MQISINRKIYPKTLFLGEAQKFYNKATMFGQLVRKSFQLLACLQSSHHILVYKKLWGSQNHVMLDNVNNDIIHSHVGICHRLALTKLSHA